MLKSIKWPLVGEAGGGHLPASPDSLQRLCTLTQYLVQLSLPGESSGELIIIVIIVVIVIIIIGIIAIIIMLG